MKLKEETNEWKIKKKKDNKWMTIKKMVKCERKKNNKKSNEKKKERKRIGNEMQVFISVKI